MLPLVSFVGSIVGAWIAEEALASRTPLSEFYPETAKGGIKGGYGWVKMHGRHVTWWGTEGDTVWIDAHYLRPMFGNIFYKDKLGAVAQSVKAARTPLEFYASFGQIKKIDLEYIKESIDYESYETGTPWTTGDKDLDSFLQDEERWLDRNYTSVDEDDEEGKAEREALRQQKYEDLAEAERKGQGDFGKWTATVRDGNHRVFGSVLGGEDRIPVRIYDNDVVDIQESARRGTLTDNQRELMQKAIRDTGFTPSWWTSP